MATNKKWFWLVLPVLALALILPLSVRKVSNPQERINVAPRAATSTGTATFSFSPASTAVNPNQSLPVNIMMSTPVSGDANGIIGAKAVFSISPASAINLTSANITTPLPSPWSYVRKEVTASGSATLVTIEAVYVASGTTGYTGAQTTPQVFATLNMTAAAVTTTTTVNSTWDITKSEIRGKTSNTDILSTNLTNGSYTIYVDSVAPDTQITGSPPITIRTNSITFTYTGTDTPPPPPLTPGALTFSYKLDSNADSAYTSSTSATLTNLSTGSHTFSVKAKDAASNVDASPATHTFTYTPDTSTILQFRLPGKTATGSHSPQNINLTVRNASFNSGLIPTTANYSTTTTNYSNPAAVIPNFTTTGSYEVLLAVPGYLHKSLTANTITLGQTNTLTRVAPADQPLWGDVTLDNTIQLNDVTAAIAVWTSSETPVTATTQLYDLDENGYITLSDITAIISSWTQSTVNGDQ